MPRHEVKEGECVASIAFAYGIVPESIRGDPANEGLWADRGEGYVLMPGDILTVPERRPDAASCVTGKRHVFRRKGVPEVFALQLLLYGEPRANVPYQLIVGETTFTGQTDDEGRLRHRIPPNATEGTLTVGESESYPLQFGALDPVTTRKGRVARLVNLGYLEANDAGDAALIAALRRFQSDQELPADGEISGETLTKLVAAHGC
jgi:hypothetical protein